MPVILAALLLAAPFQDNFKRFSVELPEGWKFAPVAGDDTGAAFKKDFEGVPAHAQIRVFPSDGSLAMLGKEMQAAVAKQPGYELVDQGPTTLSGVQAFRIRAVYLINGDKKWPKMVEDRMAMHGGNAYVVHVETLAEAFASFEGDFDAFFKGFAIPGASSSQAAAATAAALLTGPFVGRWAMVGSPKTVFELRADGTFDLDGTPGTFRVEGAQLWTTPTGGDEEAFEWKVSGDELSVSSPALDKPMRYKRVTPAKKAKGKKGAQP